MKITSIIRAQEPPAEFKPGTLFQIGREFYILARTNWDCDLGLICLNDGNIYTHATIDKRWPDSITFEELDMLLDGEKCAVINNCELSISGEAVRV